MLQTYTLTAPAWALWAPKTGFVTGTLGLSYERAYLLCRDRVANGDSFPKERPVRLRFEITTDPAYPYTTTARPVPPKR